MEKPEGADYFMGSLKVLTNLWKDQAVYAFVTATSLETPGSFRLFLCTIAPERIRFDPKQQREEKIQKLSQWGMLPLGLYLLRWQILYEPCVYTNFSDRNRLHYCIPA